MSLLTGLWTGGAERAAESCRCEPSVVERGDEPAADLVVDAADCPGDGRLAESPACRATVVDALAERDAEAVRTRSAGFERVYRDRAAALLLSAGRFVDRVAYHDDRLADRARRDPLGAARAATGRADRTAEIAATTGLAAVAAELGERRADDERYPGLAPRVAPAIARSRIEVEPPVGAELRDRRTLETGAVVRRYRTDRGGRYHLTPAGLRLEPAATAALAAASERLASGAVGGGDRAPGRAVRAVAADRDPDLPVERLTEILHRHTRGHGLFEDIFADPRVSDALAPAPVEDGPIRVVVGDDRLRTNAWLSRAAAERLASQLRATSGRAFSRASPTVDATVEVADRRVRVAGVTDPASDGPGFALRSHGREAWTLPALVANGTLTAGAAGLLSVAVERSAAGLIAGTRGAGKTTLLGALLWAVAPADRTVVIEDTPELPVERLREAGRDVQPLRTEVGGADGPAVSPSEALRTALRLGEGALVVGEVRGEEAQTLYEAMRVGAAGSAVLGTVHGDGADAVRERLVTDLGVSPSSFGATDLVVTLSAPPERRVTAIEEVRTTAEGTSFETLHDREGAALEPTGVLDRGNSRLLAALAGPEESYAGVHAAVERRADLLGDLAAADRTEPAEIDAVHRERAAGGSV